DFKSQKFEHHFSYSIALSVSRRKAKPVQFSRIHLL
ncbi:hypothetical protein AVDCRST_MAG84-2064, partial [uncultured Microcoleus sp.]